MTFHDYVQAHLSPAFLIACAAAIWVLANYTYPADSTAEFSSNQSDRLITRWHLWVILRSIVAAVLIGWIAERSFTVGFWTLLIGISLPILRSRIAPCWLAEVEILGNSIYAIGLLALVHVLHLSAAPHRPAAFSAGQLTTILFVFAVTLYLLRGGTHIVRGILEKGRILPARSTNDIHIDIDEYNRGRIIGNIERLILLIFVSIQAWSGLAFLMAAKGLFRARDLEKKDFSEYFLVGTLVSSLVAIVAGLLVLLAVHLLL